MGYNVIILFQHYWTFAGRGAPESERRGSRRGAPESESEAPLLRSDGVDDGSGAGDGERV